jgi:type I restriction enzyme, R subunit
MNEAETRAEHIDPALAAAGWGVVEGSRIRREYPITLGRIEGHGRRGKALTADYVLIHRNHKLAVVEAKAWDEEVTEGVAQAKNYAEKLAIRYTYSTNGRGIYGIDMQTGKEGDLPAYPTPDELWNLTFAEANAWRDRFAAVPFEDRGGFFQGRYYQDTAIDRVLEAITAEKSRILLTLATGTGKTFIAFQIAWKLFHSRWNLSREPSRRPRILFLADRNILADQAYNAFSAFPEDALVRIEPDEIRRRGRVPKNGSLFFTIFQTFMSGPNRDGFSNGNPLFVIPAKAGTQGPQGLERLPWTPASAGATTDYPENERQPSPYLATTHPISLISSSLTNAIAAAPMTRATGAASSITLPQPCNSA